MMKLRRLLALPLLLLCVFPALAQDATPETGVFRRDPLQILDVSAEIAEGSLTLSVHGAVTNGCGEPQVEILENTDDLVVIDLYTETTEGIECANGGEFTAEIPLATAIPQTGLTVDINGLPYLINPDGTFGAVFSAPILIRDLSAIIEDDTLVISVAGEIDGCEVPVITRRTVEDGAVNLRIYRALSTAMTCPMILVEYTADIEIPLEGDESGLWVIAVNEREIGYDFERDTSVAEGDLMRIDATINTVQVNTPTPLPQQVTITVEGYHPDGCSVPTQVRQQFDAATNTISVRIYRVLPPDVMCPSVIENFTLTIPLDIVITEGVTYTINVNGTTAEADF